MLLPVLSRRYLLALRNQPGGEANLHAIVVPDPATLAP